MRCGGLNAATDGEAACDLHTVEASTSLQTPAAVTVRSVGA